MVALGLEAADDFNSRKKIRIIRAFHFSGCLCKPLGSLKIFFNISPAITGNLKAPKP